VSPVKYELAFYITEDDILHCHHREVLKSYTILLSARSGPVVPQKSIHCIARALEIPLFLWVEILCYKCSRVKDNTLGIRKTR
jgi:hypothetical protein